MFEITVQRVFAASHALRLPGGTLEPVHGHNWELAVTVASDRLDAIDTVMDFHDLEQFVDEVIRPWHNRHLNDLPPFAEDDQGINPSAERVAWWVAQRVAARLPEGVRLESASVTEAPGCRATYRPR
jgi:6-pyruvoyltetrahydropterin/6-carboxytetrahydropterin synthase